MVNYRFSWIKSRKIRELQELSIRPYITDSIASIIRNSGSLTKDGIIEKLKNNVDKGIQFLLENDYIVKHIKIGDVLKERGISYSIFYYYTYPLRKVGILPYNKNGGWYTEEDIKKHDIVWSAIDFYKGGLKGYKSLIIAVEQKFNKDSWQYKKLTQWISENLKEKSKKQLQRREEKKSQELKKMLDLGNYSNLNHYKMLRLLKMDDPRAHEIIIDKLSKDAVKMYEKKLAWPFNLLVKIFFDDKFPHEIIREYIKEYLMSHPCTSDIKYFKKYEDGFLASLYEELNRKTESLANNLDETLSTVLQKLRPNYSRFIEKRFGKDGKYHTLEKAVEILGSYSGKRQRGHQIEERSLYKLRKPEFYETLIPFVKELGWDLNLAQESVERLREEYRTKDKAIRDKKIKKQHELKDTFINFITKDKTWES